MAKNKKTWKYTKELPDDEEIKRYVLRSHGYNPNESLDAFGYGKLGNGHVLKSDIKKLNWMKDKASALLEAKQGEIENWKKSYDELAYKNVEIESQLAAKEEEMEEQKKEIAMLRLSKFSGNVPPCEGISSWLLSLWDQIEKWYGDLKKSETGEQFLKRMQATYLIELQEARAEAEGFRKDNAELQKLVQRVYKTDELKEHFDGKSQLSTKQTTVK